MRKPTSILALILLAVAGAGQLGCRACQNCHDYASPVAGAACGECQGCRSGSCLSGEPTAVPMVAEAPTADGPILR
ncbi:hypothetical protein MalM25_12270 [Planctomycetes bacterium MalM25]|nr:hypothetical protein MalM25_12270 [Planctomycetes bacterium MalM25]